MHESQKAEMRPDEDFKPAVAERELLEQYSSHELAVDLIVAQVDRMVAEFGDPERAAGFDSRQFVHQWLESYVPALGGKPSRLLGTEEGRAQVRQVLDCSWSGAYA